MLQGRGCERRLVVMDWVRLGSEELGCSGYGKGRGEDDNGDMEGGGWMGGLWAKRYEMGGGWLIWGRRWYGVGGESVDGGKSLE